MLAKTRMSPDIETELPSSLPLLDQRQSQDSCDYSENEKPRSKARSSTCLHMWSWTGQLVFFLTSIAIAFRRSSETSCVQKLSTFCKKCSKHSFIIFHVADFASAGTGFFKWRLPGRKIQQYYLRRESLHGNAFPWSRQTLVWFDAR